MTNALSGNIESLSSEMQDILVDDLITAFENRVKVLYQAQSNLECMLDLGVKVTIETL